MTQRRIKWRSGLAAGLAASTTILLWLLMAGTVWADTTIPTTLITSPAPGQIASGALTVTGTATDTDFVKYIVEYGRGASPSVWLKYGEDHTTPVTLATLATINTLRLENGSYSFRVTTTDVTGATASDAVTVTINNTSRPPGPHGNYQLDSDLCALCHGSHTALLSPGNLKLNATKFQSQLCYTCHDGTASTFNVASEFDSNPSHHPIRDERYFGDANHTLDCSDCHDPHGSEEVDGRPYPRLLRSTDAAGVKSYQGNGFCYSCHGQNAGQDMRFFEVNNAHNNTDPGQTSTFSDPTSGTKIKCSRCHSSHGSQKALLRLNTDAVVCGSCHPDTPYADRTDNELVASARYFETRNELSGLRIFSQDTTQAPPSRLRGPYEIPWTWTGIFKATLSSGIMNGIAVGDATNDGINDIAVAYGSYVTTRSQLTVNPGTANGRPQPVITFDGKGGHSVLIDDINADGLNETIVSGQGTSSTITVNTIIGGVVIGSYQANSGGTGTRRMAVGDIDGDGAKELVVANYLSNTISVFKLLGGRLSLNQTVPSGGAYPYGIAIGDVNNDGKNEVVAVNQAYSLNYTSYQRSFTADSINVFNWQNGTLNQIGALYNTDGTGDNSCAMEVAIADVIDSLPGKEIVVSGGFPSHHAGDIIGDVTVFNYNTSATPKKYTSAGVYTAGLAVGDLDGDGKADVAVENADTVGVLRHGVNDLGAVTLYNNNGWYFDGQALAIGDVGKIYPYGHKAMDTCTDCHDPHGVTKANPFQGIAGVEPVYNNTPGRRQVFAQDVYWGTKGSRSGTWTKVSAGIISYDCWYYQSSTAGSYIEIPFTGNIIELIPGATGTDNAGTGLVSIDGVVQATVDFANASAGNAYQPIYSKTGLSSGNHVFRLTATGARGGGTGTPNVFFNELVISNSPTATSVKPLTKTYQLCLKCHARNGGSFVGGRDIAAELSPANVSYHSVMAPGRRTTIDPTSFVAPWTQTSRVTCFDCHGKDVAETGQIRHGSANAGLLIKPAEATPPADPNLLCYKCHSMAFYGPGSANDLGAGFWARVSSQNNHHWHSNLDITCTQCHEAHGNPESVGMIKNYLLQFSNGTFGADINKVAPIDCASVFCHK